MGFTVEHAQENREMRLAVNELLRASGMTWEQYWDLEREQRKEVFSSFEKQLATKFPQVPEHRIRRRVSGGITRWHSIHTYKKD